MVLYLEKKEQRIRDPVHGLIVFSMSDDFERLMWSLINASEFQRLRRIKQLGFSELVYPGATHTRFSHSVGVFHTSRELVGLLRSLLGNDFSKAKAQFAKRRHGFAMAAVRQALGGGRSASSMR